MRAFHHHFKNRLVPIFLTIFIDLLGLGMVIPIFALLFLDPVHSILPLHTTFAAKALILGSLTAAYPAAQFFGAPILGALSDHRGRRPVLILSFIGTIIGYFLFALGIITANVPLLFASRILDGFTGGNICVATSAIADISTPETKPKNFGLVGAAFGLGFILGPVIGSRLSDPHLVSWFTYATPFFFAGFLSLANLFLLLWAFEETLHTKVNTPVSLLTGFHNLKRAFQLPELRAMFASIFFLAIGFNIFAQFFQVFLIQRFNYNQVQIGTIFAYLGLWIAISQGLLIRPLAKRFKAYQIYWGATLLMGLVFPAILFPDKASVLFYILPFLAIFYGFTQPSSTTLISDLTDDNSQGEILGINQSIQSLTQALPPIIAGLVAALSVEMPIIIAAISSLLAWVVYAVFFKPPLPPAPPPNKFIEVG